MPSNMRKIMSSHEVDNIINDEIYEDTNTHNTYLKHANT